jgi:hypothetical protein
VSHPPLGSLMLSITKSKKNRHLHPTPQNPWWEEGGPGMCIFLCCPGTCLSASAFLLVQDLCATWQPPSCAGTHVVRSFRPSGTCVLHDTGQAWVSSVKARSSRRWGSWRVILLWLRQAVPEPCHFRVPRLLLKAGLCDFRASHEFLISLGSGS